MTLLEVIQLIGYSTAAALHLWIGGLLFKRRRSIGAIERVLMVLAVAMGVWHGSNLTLALHSMLGSAGGVWLTLLRLVDSLAVISITLSYSLLLHVHLHLWADARARPLTLTEKARVYLSYLPAIFLVYAVPKLWTGEYAPLFDKLSRLLLPFALWATYVLCLVAITDLLIARFSKARSERRLMLTLALSFVGIAALIFAVYALGAGEGTTTGLYLKTFANLGSLLPTALLAYHIYRYRYLELIIKESLIVASFAAVVLVVYLYGIRTLGEWLTTRYQLRPGVVESILILLLALTASPLRRWLDRRFRQFFEREAALYRDVVARIGANAGRYQRLPELLRFVEERTVAGLGLKRVRLLTGNTATSTSASDNVGSVALSDNEVVLSDDGVVLSDDGSGIRRQGNGSEVEEGDARRVIAVKDFRENVEPETELMKKVLERVAEAGRGALEGDALLRERGYELAYPLRREDREVGLMLVDAEPDALTDDVRAMLEILAGQVAIAVEDCRLVEENVRLERRLAQGERLAALGQMAATVAHEVRNPLSAIKSIAQVMREDEYLKREYDRDLKLIVGETERLSRSVSQMLNFARTAPQRDAPGRLDELVRSIVYLFGDEAEKRGVSVKVSVEAGCSLEGETVSAVRDALSNLLLNAIQETPPGGRAAITGHAVDGKLIITVEDGGAGVAPENRERIWEPFFTTKQRGTGLGLAIVRKR
ncbi:MAG: ATP-binding protein, partial [Pyrinomonadaceae bacterium]